MPSHPDCLERIERTQRASSRTTGVLNGPTLLMSGHCTGPRSPAGKRVALFPVRNSRLMRLAWPLGATISILLRLEPARDGWRGTTPPIACPLHQLPIGGEA